jgi:hypothetical protein
VIIKGVSVFCIFQQISFVILYDGVVWKSMDADILDVPNMNAMPVVVTMQMVSGAWSRFRFLPLGDW